jgi:hypothetical protein
MANFFGKLLRNEEGHLSMKIKMSPQNPEMITVPLEELLEDFIDQDISVEIFKVRARKVSKK